MAAAMELGYQQNNSFKGKYFNKPGEEADNIYLSAKELKEIESLNLNGTSRLDRVRNLFLVACETN